MYTGGWIKIITDEETINITDKVSGFMFLEAKAAYPTTNNDSITVKGVDGELPSSATFAPFNLVVKCGFDGYDTKDANLAEQELRNIFYKRKPYYVVTSDNPNIKYAVRNPDINPDYTDYRAIRFEINFSVFKGYSESIDDTSQFSLSNGRWQFESGVLATPDVHYSHDHTAFRIYNGSSDTVNPIMRHNFKLIIHAAAPKGLKITNTTTGDVFEYKEPLNYANELVINGVHPFLDRKQRVGKYTNFEWITLAPGYNQIVITGENIKKVQTEWIFNFIYR
ncbi:phage tail family protein [Staphylococcus condimenti]|uniref:phage tail domain-containing protein n=1 Tax=Staphylococcus condimenti TaxID=70255 RepID=UPI00255140F4|nr:phage tail domain-containing protein [Staphylococcus condimenti]MDK8646344.1 phage tail family protein [Staphylococcus condimenti]